MNKSFLKSKTLWVSLIVGIAPLFPAVQTYIKANPEIAGTIVATVFGVLRVLTKGAVVMTEDTAK